MSVIDLDEILTVNSMWQNKNWAMGESEGGFGLEFIRKSKLNFFNQKTKIIERDGFKSL